MSQDQATKPVETTDTQQNQSRVHARPLHDAMATEEIRSAFEQDRTQEQSKDALERSNDMGFFREGLASAFAMEEATPKSYEPPPMLQTIQHFFDSYDFADRSDKTRGFTTVSGVYQDIRSCQAYLQSLQSQNLSGAARQQVMDDLAQLSSFQVQAFDYMEEVRPTF